MMKLSLAFLVVLALVGAVTVHASPVSNTNSATGDPHDDLEDFLALLPTDQIVEVVLDCLEDDPQVQEAIEYIESDAFHKIVPDFEAMNEADDEIDLQHVADLLDTVFRRRIHHQPLSRASDELMEDLSDFLALVPIDYVMDIAIDYVLNDAEVQKAAVYVRSKEFQKLASAAQQNEPFRACLRYLDNSGLPATSFMNRLNSALGIPPVNPSALRRTLRAGGGVRGMLDDIEAALPREEIKALYEHKKKNSKAFSYLIERLEAPEFQKIIDDLAENKDVQNLGYQAASFGIDLEAIIDFFRRVFGIEISHDLLPRFTRSLEDDLKEFVDLLDVKKIRSIVVRYVLLDKEVKAAVAYVRSKEFVQLINDLNNIPEYHDLLKSLKESGLDVDRYIELIHKLLGISRSNMVFRFARKTGGIAGMIKEIEATLPVDDIKALYNQKLTTSKEFAGLVELISSDKFQAVTDALFANKIFQDILHRLQSHGIDLQVVADFFLKIFGITTPPGIIDFRFRLQSNNIFA